MPAWFMVVPAKLADDLWQLSQLKLVGIWLAGFAVTPAVTPWQVAQVPGETVGCVKLAPKKELVPL